MPQSRRRRFRLILFLCGGPIAQFRSERTPDKREVVGSIPTRPTIYRVGGVAQSEERLLCTQEVIGSNPFTSTSCSEFFSGFIPWLFDK